MRGQLISARPPMGARGGIGRRARFRSVFRKEWWFDSTRAHHSLPRRAIVIRAALRGRPFQAFHKPLIAARLQFGLVSSRGRLKRRQKSTAEGEGTVADWTSLRLTWEPRLPRILRI